MGTVPMSLLPIRRVSCLFFEITRREKQFQLQRTHLFLNFHHKELVIRTAARSLSKVFAPFHPSEEIMLLDLGLNPLVDIWTGLLSFFPFLIAYTFFFKKVIS